MYPRVVRPSVCVSATLVHPAKAVGRNEMPFGRDTRVVPSNIVLDGSPSLPMHGKTTFGDGTLSRRDQSAAANSKHLY